MRVLKDLCRSLQKTVVVVTHDSRIFGLADRILKLVDGAIVADSTSEREAPADSRFRPAALVSTGPA
jgi:ABC-type siderophore export system fused ATPase/permease subunit